MRDDRPCIRIYQENQDQAALSFWDILLDETLIQGTVYVPRECLKKVSGVNRRLPGKRNYEFILRLAAEFPVILTGTKPDVAGTQQEGTEAQQKVTERFLCIEEENRTDAVMGLKTDCYIVSRYKKQLLERLLFDAAVQSIIDAAQAAGCRDEICTVLSGMLTEDAYYRYLYQGSQPFLIYKGADVCYNMLNVFAQELGCALQKQGYLVEYFDVAAEDFTESYRFIGRSYQAGIGVQSYMFSARLNGDGGFLHDKIDGPKYNFVFDHPVRFEQHLKETPANLTILSLDRNYVAFAKKYYGVNACFFPPGGNAAENAAIQTASSMAAVQAAVSSTVPMAAPRRYAVTFVGTYFDNTAEVRDGLRNMERKERFLVNRLWLIMRKQPYLPAEKALELALKYYKMELPGQEFLRLLCDRMKYVVFMSHYYRRKMIGALVRAGIKVDVFGKSWHTSALCAHPNFIWHDIDLSPEESNRVYGQSKIVLNIMSWHKDGITERVINGMLAGAVVLTERNPYMEEEFGDGEDVVLYDLDDLDALPGKVRELLADAGRMETIARRGQEKAYAGHTWDCRAAGLAEMACQDSSAVSSMAETRFS